jgi:hypothetical protein
LVKSHDYNSYESVNYSNMVQEQIQWKGQGRDVA